MDGDLQEHTMIDRDANLLEFFKNLLPYITTVSLSVLAGTVRHIQILRENSKSFELREWLFDIFISSFAGLLTYFACEFAGITGPLQALLISISAHMGAKSLQSYENIRDGIFEAVISKYSKPNGKGE